MMYSENNKGNSRYYYEFLHFSLFVSSFSNVIFNRSQYVQNLHNHKIQHFFEEFSENEKI